MGDTREIAVVETNPASKATQGSLVADVLRRHPSKPAPVNPSTLLRSAIGFEAPADDLAGHESDLRHASNDDGDAMGPARGIAVGLALMLPFWGAVGFAIHAALR